MSMVQFGLWGNCCNDCDFCLRKNRIFMPPEQMVNTIEYIKNNILYIDWKNKFSHGISLLGGELYHITDKKVQNSFLSLIDVIIEKILKVSTNPLCRYSSVTNGLYVNTDFLFKVLDKISDAVGTEKIDINFSYDLKYRYKTEDDRKLALHNIQKTHLRYNYAVGVQMILTQHVIDSINNGQFNINSFMENDIQGNNFVFLYPHEIQSGRTLDDFFFKRSDFLNFISFLYDNNYRVALNTIKSIENSAVFKYTGYHDKGRKDYKQDPLLSDGKEIINSVCGHSILYKCYSDSNTCMLCDVNNMGFF